MIIVNPETLIIAAVNSSLLEIRTWPKPGNVHKTFSFSNTTYDDFLATAYSSKSVWKDVFEEQTKMKLTPSKLYVTSLSKSVNNMMQVQSGGNTILGHYLLMLPLFISSIHYITNNIQDETTFWEFTYSIIKKSKASDTVILYQALREAQPGGMGTKSKYDLFSKHYQKELLQDNINLEKIFDLSKSYDGISQELIENYKFTREIIIPKLNDLFSEYENLNNLFFHLSTESIIQHDIYEISVDLNELLIRAFLFVLSQRTDTLISRKTNVTNSKHVSNTAKSIFEKYYTLPKSKWNILVKEFNAELHQSKGKLNPGTTADMLACAIFVYIIRKRVVQ